MAGSQHLTEPTYLFVDAEHLRQYHGEFTQAWFGEGAHTNFNQIKRRAIALRMFYYDSLDERQKPRETKAEFDLRLETRRTEHAAVRAVTGAHVRLGTVTGEKRRRQKQVDILLAVDMMNHAARQNMKKAVLLAGDQDFKPIVDSLVLLGTFIEVWGDKKHTSADLVNAADSHLLLSGDDYYGFTDNASIAKHPKPESTSVSYREGEYDGALWARGQNGDATFTLSRVGDNWRVYVPVTPDAAILYKSPDEQRLKLYINLQYGDVKWKAESD